MFNKLLQDSWAELVLHSYGHDRKLSAKSRLSEGDWKSRALWISLVGKSILCVPNQEHDRVQIQSRGLGTVADAHEMLLLFTMKPKLYKMVLVAQISWDTSDCPDSNLRSVIK